MRRPLPTPIHVLLAGSRRLTRALGATAALLAVGAICALPAAADPPSTLSRTWIPDGSVNAVAVSGSTAFIGGQFDRLAEPSRGFAALNPASGQRQSAWPDVTGMVMAAIRDGSGGWYIGGAFTAVGGVPRENLAHVRSDGTLDPGWAPSVRGHVKALVRHGKTVFAGGRFDQANGTARGNIAGFDATTGALRPFSVVVSGSVSTVNALAVAGPAENPSLYAGGTFSMANGVTRNNLAAFSINNSSLRTFDPNVNNEVLSIAISGAVVYAAGNFTVVNGNVGRRHLAAFETGLGLATSWDPDVNGPVRAIQLVGSTLYAGGRFGVVNDRGPVEPAKPRHSLAAFDTSTGRATTWAPQLGGPFSEGALTLAVVGSTVYVGGLFQQVNGTTPRVNVAAFNASSGAVTGFDPNPDQNGIVGVVAGDGSRTVIGGTFKVLGGVERSNLAAIDLTTGRPTGFNPRVGGAVHALAVAGSKVWAGGSFIHVNGTIIRHRLAAFDASSGAVTSFSQGIDQPVDALAVSGSTVYAAGRFTEINGVSTRRRILRFRDIAGTTGALTTWDPDVDGPVNALALSEGRLFLGGAFGTVGGAPRANIAAVDTATGAVSPFRADLDAQVRALALNGTTLYAGGDFTTVRGTTQRSRTVALDAQTAAVLPWKADANAPVRTLGFVGPQLIAGGDFSSIGGQPRSYIAALNPSSGAVAPWAPQLTTSFLFPVRAVAPTASGGLVVGGNFTVPFGPVRPENLAVFAPSAATGPAEPLAPGDRGAPALTRLTASARRRITIDVSEAGDLEFVAKRGRRTVRFTRTVTAGPSRLAILPRELGPGRYRLWVVPTDLAGNVGRARTVRMRIGPRP